MDQKAFYGLLGRITRLIEPATEADPAAILAQMIAAFGNVVGRNPYFEVEASQHHSNLFQCIVGRSSKGRKGTSLNHIMRFLRDVDADWCAERTATGLSSGEGVIWAVRDPIRQPQRNRETGQIEDVIVDNGINDKRLFIAETEFAQGLKVMSRPTNILSAVIRNAWDTGNLRTLIKNNPARASDAHISIIGHITEEELKRELNQCELFNGFANRFLWLVAQRARLLPEGGKIPQQEFNALACELTNAIKLATTITEMRRDEKAREFWHKIYAEVSSEGRGMSGLVCNRAEAQLLRLSMVYALSDGSAEIKFSHLEAALAFWEYCKASAHYLFGDRLSDPNAQKLFEAIKLAYPNGLTRKHIFDVVFQKNISKDSLQFAFDTLEKSQLARKEIEQTGGRPSERWFFK